ncbi:hypothetical protein AB835_13125 [Candidatus Endobugula sertula]|uniref:Cobalt transporter n=1 Tax=Candidatus Endobugula sertula TaxID=62101 RepID=A0A1D2QM32_9GAMM|nr:hypothetical protein AB835_13125 [Candidatus Endobugula sertula]
MQQTQVTTGLFTLGQCILIQNIAALIFGMIIIFAVGFMPMEAAHNASHDTRHVLTFPCH